MSSPKVSVCIPSYRHQHLLEQALNSVLLQSFEDYEIIISDDTPDPSLENFVQNHYKDRRIRFFRHHSSGKVADNWNNCIQQSKGEFIKFLHHDDSFSSRNSLQRFVDLMNANPMADLGCSSSYNVDDTGSLVYIHSVDVFPSWKIQEVPSILFATNAIGSPSATIFRNTGKVFFDANLKWLIDIDFYISILERNPRVALLEQPLVKILVNSECRITHVSFNNADVEVSEHAHVFLKKMNHHKMSRYYLLKTLLILKKFYGSTSLPVQLVALNWPCELKSLVNLSQCYFMRHFSGSRPTHLREIFAFIFGQVYCEFLLFFFLFKSRLKSLWS